MFLVYLTVCKIRNHRLHLDLNIYKGRSGLSVCPVHPFTYFLTQKARGPQTYLGLTYPREETDEGLVFLKLLYTRSPMVNNWWHTYIFTARSMS